MSIPILVRRLPHAEGLPLPSYATAGAAGMDLIAAVRDPVSIGPGERALIPTGLTIALPPGFELQIRPRSGLALRHGITLPNTPGTIDEDYRGEIGVIVLNTGQERFVVERGARIAQAVLAPVSRAVWQEVEGLDVTTRDAGGFGSTGFASTEFTSTEFTSTGPSSTASGSTASGSIGPGSTGFGSAGLGSTRPG